MRLANRPTSIFQSAPSALAIAASCKQKSGNERWPCPADGVIRAASGLCNCDVDGSALMISGWGKPCGACNSQMCGGQCGSCPFGEVCLDGLCAPGNLCCLADNQGEHCSQGADFCVLPPGPFGPGTQCYCDVRAQDDLTYYTNRVYGITVGPGQTCDSF
ncbi:hypothetical protein WME97_14495 [Sorangium sp. So ce367]|uniref:hypothetical protein n=1 Tax=Sorangium sp. So ce367 TaxID=3133305 RepID=UPI003F63EE1F